MNHKKNIERLLSHYDFDENQKVRFLVRAKEIVDSDISKDYKWGIIQAVAEFISREKERQDESLVARQKSDFLELLEKGK